jgi:hypothetical protein
MRIAAKLALSRGSRRPVAGESDLISRSFDTHRFDFFIVPA